ncbi:hypothetical protein C5610_10320 [Idiomarina sp. OT37-5b]|nr:hypothetical protein C5610_10320 [Idiomarina sp. OT37-5b]
MRPIQFGHSQEGNKMKKVLSALTITALMASPVFADAQHKHGDDKTGSMSGMMHHEKMTSMNEHMQEMREAMEKIKSESDPKKRKKLMEEHMKSMQKGMQMMNHGMDKGMNKGEHKKGDKAEQMGKENMMNKMKMMEHRMDMMQMMIAL